MGPNKEEGPFVLERGPLFRSHSCNKLGKSGGGFCSFITGRADVTAKPEQIYTLLLTLGLKPVLHTAGFIRRCVISEGGRWRRGTHSLLLSALMDGWCINSYTASNMRGKHS